MSGARSIPAQGAVSRLLLPRDTGDTPTLCLSLSLTVAALSPVPMAGVPAASPWTQWGLRADAAVPLQSYGPEHLLTFHNLKRMGLLTEQAAGETLTAVESRVSKLVTDRAAGEHLGRAPRSCCPQPLAAMRTVHTDTDRDAQAQSTC